MTRLNKLKDENWADLKEILIFGSGRQGWKMYQTLKKEFHILAVLDNDLQKKGALCGSHRIQSVEEAGSLVYQHKIIVTASQYYYQEIRRQLSDLGLQEYVHFVMYQQFVTEWFFKYRGKVNVLKTDVSLTARCTLNCENCMQFLPYWKHAKENPLSKIKEDLDVYFQCIDYLLDLDIVGGEPFLYSQMEEFIAYIGENYRSRIGYIGFITNGMVVPKPAALRLMAKYDMEVSITDYSENIEYAHKIPQLKAALEAYGIHYMQNKNIDWFDFGFPKKTYHYSGQEAVRHMQRCNSIEHVLDNQRLYYCGLEWAAQKGGLFEDEKKGYIDLAGIARGTKEQRQAVLELVMGNIEGGCLEFCRVCGGFGIDNDNRVETARQMPRKGQT